MKPQRLTKILALDLHPRSFGYVVIDSSTEVRDLGVCRSYRKTNKHQEVLVGKRLRPLLKLWMPDLVIVRVGGRREKGLRSLFRQIRKEVNGNAFLPIKAFEDPHPGRSKYERAVEIAERFPEIGWKLPPKRKPWESEHYSISIFEALAVAVRYPDLNCTNKKESRPAPLSFS
jgi:hypothetical protein